MAADAYPHPLADFVCQGESKDLHSYFEQSVQNLLKESSEKFKGWLSTPGPLNTELSCKKVNATVRRGLGVTQGNVYGVTPGCHRCCGHLPTSQQPWHLFPLVRRDQRPLPWPGWGLREAALGWRVLCAQQRHRVVRGAVPASSPSPAARADPIPSPHTSRCSGAALWPWEPSVKLLGGSALWESHGQPA